MKKHSQLKWLASLALGAGVLAAYGIHDAQAAYAALPADGTAGVVLHGGGVGTPYEMNSGRTMKSSSCRQEATAGQKSVIRL